MRSAVRRIGNSAGMILPKSILDGLRLGVGDTLEVALRGDEAVIKAGPRKVREGWEEDSRRLAAEGLSEEDIEWLEAPLNSEAEAKLEW